MALRAAGNYGRHRPARCPHWILRPAREAMRAQAVEALRQKAPNNRAAVHFDFTRPPLVDLSNVSGSPTPNASTLQLEQRLGIARPTRQTEQRVEDRLERGLRIEEAARRGRPPAHGRLLDQQVPHPRVPLDEPRVHVPGAESLLHELPRLDRDEPLVRELRRRVESEIALAEGCEQHERRRIVAQRRDPLANAEHRRATRDRKDLAVHPKLRPEVGQRIDVQREHARIREPAAQRCVRWTPAASRSSRESLSITFGGGRGGISSAIASRSACVSTGTTATAYSSRDKASVTREEARRRAQPGCGDPAGHQRERCLARFARDPCLLRMR